MRRGQNQPAVKPTEPVRETRTDVRKTKGGADLVQSGGRRCGSVLCNDSRSHLQQRREGRSVNDSSVLNPDSFRCDSGRTAATERINVTAMIRQLEIIRL